jgi:archaemetzincin
VVFRSEPRSDFSRRDAGFKKKSKISHANICYDRFSLVTRDNGFQAIKPGNATRRCRRPELAGGLLKRAFAPDSPDFQPIPNPGPRDWLAVHHDEPRQTFDDFLAQRPNRPASARHVIYLQPLGEFPPEDSPLIAKLCDFAAAFFAMEVRALPAVGIGTSFSTRHNPYTGNLQILTGDVLDFLKSRLPSDAFCILAITMEDLYPDPSWNFVFGQASPRERVGVYSFARYDPDFYGEPWTGDKGQLVLRRSCKVLAHETGHIFGLAHCAYFSCLMNGSNHLVESDRRPLHLCPVCLRKLHWSIGFNVVERYASLERVTREANFIDEADWLSRQLKRLGSE